MGTHEQELRLHRHPAEVERARRQVAQFCAEMPGELSSVAELLASELVTNAVVHGAGDILLRLAVADHTVRVEVADDSPHGPEPQPADTERLSGRGLWIVEELAAAWGVTPSTTGPGKAVWFTLRLPPT